MDCYTLRSRVVPKKFDPIVNNDPIVIDDFTDPIVIDDDPIVNTTDGPVGTSFTIETEYMLTRPVKSYEEFVAWVDLLKTKNIKDCSCTFEAYICLIVQKMFDVPFTLDGKTLKFIDDWKLYIQDKYPSTQYPSCVRFINYKPMIEHIFGVTCLTYQLKGMYDSQKYFDALKIKFFELGKELQNIPWWNELAPYWEIVFLDPWTESEPYWHYVIGNKVNA